MMERMLLLVLITLLPMPSQCNLELPYNESDCTAPVGTTPRNFSSRGTNHAYLMLNNTFKCDGMVAAWKYYRTDLQPGVFVGVWRIPANGPEHYYELIGKHELKAHTVGETNVTVPHSHRFLVKAGDFLGIHHSGRRSDGAVAMATQSDALRQEVRLHDTVVAGLFDENFIKGLINFNTNDRRILKLNFAIEAYLDTMSVACNTPEGATLAASLGHIRHPENPEMYKTEMRGVYPVFKCLWTIPLETGQTMSVDVTPKLARVSCDANVLTIGIKRNMVDDVIKDPIFKYCGQNRMITPFLMNETTVILFRATKDNTSEISIRYNISGPCPTLHGPFEGGKLEMNSATRATFICNEGLVRESKPTLNKQRIICNRTTNTWTEELDRCVTVSSFTTLPGVAASTVKSTTSSEALGNGEASNGNGTALVIVISLLVVVLIVIAIVVAVCLSVRAKRRESIKESRIIADRLQVNALYSKELQETPVGDSNNGSINDINREHNAQTDEKNDDQTAAEAQLLLGENDDRKEGSKMYEEIGNPGTAENGDIVPVDGEAAEKPVYAVVHKDKGDKWKTAEVPDDVEMKDNELYGTDESV